MKKTICFLMLFSIMEPLLAQHTATNGDKTFEVPSGNFERRFRFDLKKGNKMQVELDNPNDLELFANVDSVLRTFLADIALLKDSLGDELFSRRIDYTTDSAGRKRIRLQQFKPKGSSFVIENGEAASLKLEQDTVHITGTIPYTLKYALQPVITGVRHYRLSFFVNSLSELPLYTDGSLNKKIAVLQASLKNNTGTTWNTTATAGTAYLNADRSITARSPKGVTAGGTYLNVRISADLQNYKAYFVPSFSLGAGVGFSTNHIMRRDFFLSWDPHFFFARDNGGKLKTFRNYFLTLSTSYGSMKNHEPKREFNLLGAVSLGYLVKREGEFYDPHTFRLGAGRVSLFGGKTKIEPVLYFNDSFKPTPGLRLIQSF